MSVIPPGRFGRIHLSTAIVLIFMVATLLGLNIAERLSYTDGRFSLTTGWPIVFAECDLSYAKNVTIDGESDPGKLVRLSNAYVLSPEGRLLERRNQASGHSMRLDLLVFGLMDIAICIAILIGTWVGLEYLIRRRDIKK